MHSFLLKHHLPLKHLKGHGIHTKKKNTLQHGRMLYKHGKHTLAHRLHGGAITIVEGVDRNEPLEMARTRNAKHYKSLQFRV